MITSNRQSKNWGPFARRLKTPDDAPEPLRSALFGGLTPEDDIRLLIFSPADCAMAKDSQPTILVVTDRGWLVVGENDADSAKVARCDFANTVLVEMTSILLYGLLRIDFATGGPVQSSTIHFNTVTRGLFQEAAELLLNGMDSVTMVTPVESREMHPIVDALPLKFCNALLEFTPMGQRALAAVHWPAILGQRRLWFQPELAPQAALAVTDRELLVVSEEKAWRRMRPGQTPKYGNIVTHCPFSRIEILQVCEHSDMNTVDVTLRVAQGSEKLKIPFPRERKQEVQDLIDVASRQAGKIKTANPLNGLTLGRNGNHLHMFGRG
jgi:hypothetical protein